MSSNIGRCYYIKLPPSNNGCAYSSQFFKIKNELIHDEINYWSGLYIKYDHSVIEIMKDKIFTTKQIKEIWNETPMGVFNGNLENAIFILKNQ